MERHLLSVLQRGYVRLDTSEEFLALHLYQSREGYDDWSATKVQRWEDTFRGHEAGHIWTASSCDPPPESEDEAVADRLKGAVWMKASQPQWYRRADGLCEWRLYEITIALLPAHPGERRR